MAKNPYLTPKRPPGPPLGKHECGCGWFREWHVDQRGLTTINHPLYGRVTSRRAAELDVYNHDCYSYKFAVNRLRQVILNGKAA